MNERLTVGTQKNNTVWRAIKPLLDERTASRVIFLQDAEALQQELLGSFSKTELPSWLGGHGSEEDVTLLNGTRVDTAAVRRQLS